jgi:hypothetical protein
MLACVTAAAAQETAPATKAYVIRSVDFQIQGRTKAFVLMTIVDPYRRIVGSKFADRESLEAFIADKTRLLASQRVLESARASYDTSPAPGNSIDVALHFETKDSWNIIALPYGTYDSNNGLLLSLRGRDYDFLGSAQPLELNLNYQKSPNSISSYGMQFDFTAPFQALGAVWSLGFVEDGEFWTDGTGSSITTASISYNVPGLDFPLSISAAQSLSYDAYAQTAIVDPDSWFLGETGVAVAQIPITAGLGSWSGVELGPLGYVPSIEVDYSWKPGQRLDYYGNGTAPSAFDPTAAQALQNSPAYYGRGGVLVSVSNGLSLGRVDWAGNMRQGLSLSLTDRESYNAQWADLMSDLNLTAQLFAQWNHNLGIGLRLLGMARLSGDFPQDDLTMLGQYMRGILDGRVSGVQALIFNGNLNMKLFDFPSHIFIKTHVLDFELQAEPFLDAGLVRPDYSSAFTGDWLWYSGGLELLFFPQGLRSFIVRASAGWDLKNVAATQSLTALTPDGLKPYEVHIGLSLFF